MAQLPRVIEVTDDSGFLGIVDPDAYATYVSNDWTLEQLFEHFRSEMDKRTLLLWGTGMECTWRVEITGLADSAPPPGFRRASGPIRITQGRLLLVSYEDLTMAAQFADESLHRQHLTKQLVELPSGDYTCEITQLDDPDTIDDDDDDSDEATDLLLRLTPDQGHVPWSAPMWFERDW